VSLIELIDSDQSTVLGSDQRSEFNAPKLIASDRRSGSDRRSIISNPNPIPNSSRSEPNNFPSIPCLVSGLRSERIIIPDQINRLSNNDNIISVIRLNLFVFLPATALHSPVARSTLPCHPSLSASVLEPGLMTTFNHVIMCGRWCKCTTSQLLCALLLHLLA